MNMDAQDGGIIAVVVAIFTALGGMKGVHALVKRAVKIDAISSTMEERTAAIQKSIEKIDKVIVSVEGHSSRLAALEESRVPLVALEEDVHRQDALLFSIIESLDYGAWICDTTGACLHCNTALARIMKWKDPYISLSWKDCIHPDDREEVVERWQEFVEGKRSMFSAEYRYLGRDGTETKVSAMANRPFVKGKQPPVIFGWVRLVPEVVQIVEAHHEKVK